MRIVNDHFVFWGFENINEFFNSLFHINYFSLYCTAIMVVLGILESYVSEFIGLEPIVYVAFILLLVSEFVTGMLVSIKNKKPIQSRRFGRMILKVVIYTMILGMLHVLKVGLNIPVIFGFEVNIYEWLYYAIFNLIILQLIISIFENLNSYGVTESSAILRVLKLKFSKWFLNGKSKSN